MNRTTQSEFWTGQPVELETLWTLSKKNTGVGDADIDGWEEDARALGIADEMIASMRKMLRRTH